MLERINLSKSYVIIRGVKVEYISPDTPKLNNMVERGFIFRWEIAKTLFKNPV